MHTEMKQEVWQVQSLMKVWLQYFTKHKNDMHAPAALQRLAIGCLVFELSKLKFRAYNYFLKGTNKVH